MKRGVFQITTSVGLDVDDIVGSLDREELAQLIAAIDLNVADWDFTEQLIAHFKQLEIDLCNEEGYIVTPKLIKP